MTLLLKKKEPNLTSLCRQEFVYNLTSSVRKSCLGLRNNELLIYFSNQSISMKFTVFGDHPITKAEVYQKFTVHIIFVPPLWIRFDFVSPF